MPRTPLACSFLAIVVSCAPPPLDSAGAGATGEPSIRIIFPESSTEVYYCSTFMVTVDVDNYTLSDEHVGGENIEGEGHWHLYDGDTYLTWTAEEYAWIPEDKPLVEGQHAIEVVLADNDHQEHKPKVSWIAEILVDDTPPGDTGEGCIGGGRGSSSGY